MIEPMKKVSVIVQTHDKSDMLRALRKAGLLHVVDNPVDRTETADKLQKQGESLEKICSVLEELSDKKHPVKQKNMDDESFQQFEQKLSSCLEEQKELTEQEAKDTMEVERICSWGDFDPSEIAQLQASVDLSFYSLSKKELALLKDVSYIELAPVGNMQAIAVVNGKDRNIGCGTRFELPQKSLSFLRNEIERIAQRKERIQEQLVASLPYLDCLRKHIQRNVQDKRFETISSQMYGDEELSWLVGYLPSVKEKDFARLAKSNGWGYMMDDPTMEDNPPTLLRYRKGLGIIQPLYDLLGTLPGYREYDVSLWFLLFFTLFFAMIIGDAGYGLLFVLLAVILHVKQRKANTLVCLVYVLGFATVVWGSLTGTWFGSEKLLIAVPFLQRLVIPTIANYPELFGVDAQTAQNSLMKFCFMLGTIQLSLACVLNVIHKIPKKNLSAFADIGWLMNIISLYFVILLLVIGEKINVTLAFSVVGIGFGLVIVFGCQAPGQSFWKGMKSGLGGLFTTFLNTISCFSNTMSYIRLFAVGMATLAIAQSFNSMGTDLFGTPVGVVIGIVVLLIGHGLNLVMGMLSVIVHGVRLNLLEFSGQLGMEWSGIKYEPFKEMVKEN